MDALEADSRAVCAIRDFYNCDYRNCPSIDECPYGSGKETSTKLCTCGANDFYAGYMFGILRTKDEILLKYGKNL